jgi:hypothetical protein
VRDLALRDRADLVSLQCHHRCGPAVERNELELLGRTVAIHMHDGAHVASLEAFIWNGGRQDDPSVFSDHAGSSLDEDRR